MSDWTRRWLNMAKEVSTWSKDPSSQVGCVIVKDRQLLSIGYNGLPRGIKDTSERLEHRETKYKYVVHAEKNAIYNAVHNGVQLEGATAYIYRLPVCPECAKGLIQAGIKTVVMELEGNNPAWEEAFTLTKEMFDECGISYYIY